MSTCKISIFIPVYNGSNYLAETIDSILAQTFKDFELVCVDDSSTDQSYDILKEYAKTDSRVIVYQKPNGGIVPKSWNFVLPFLNSSSILYMSQDDLLPNKHLEILYARQQETGADCVLPDMIYYHDNESDNKAMIGLNGNRDSVLTNKEAVELSLTWKIHGFALWNAKLFKNEYYEEDAFDSDEFMTRKLFFKSNKIVFCDSKFYYRQDNKFAITKTFGLKNYDILLTDFRIYEFLKENGFEERVLSKSLYQLSISFMTWYRMFLLKKGIKSKTDETIVSAKFSEYFLRFKNHDLFQMSKSFSRTNKIRAFSNAIVLQNFFVFKSFMGCVHIYDAFSANKKDKKIHQ